MNENSSLRNAEGGLPALGARSRARRPVIAKPDSEGKHLRLGAAGLRSAASIVQASERGPRLP